MSSTQSTHQPDNQLEKEKRFELTKLEDDGDKNNYEEFEFKAKWELRANGMWKYIEGDSSVPPSIPKLRKETKITGKDENDVEHTIIQPSNEHEVKKALNDSKSWFDGDSKALAAIVKAVPRSKLHLVKPCQFAREAWLCLKAEYRSVNSMKATRLKQNILGYNYVEGWNVTNWRNDMQRMYQELCDIDSSLMSDDEFA